MAISQEDIQIISRNSSISDKEVDQLLKTHVYNNRTSWLKFLQVFFMSLGIGLSVIGILFFFAYNWDSLHKFVKLGIIQLLISIFVLSTLIIKSNSLIKQILLTGATLLVGVLFAVFGQIYQTGANAYDFFLGWAIAVFLWILIANFTPLWLLFMALINITLMFYIDQVAPNWDDFLTPLLFIGLNMFFLISTLFFKYKKHKIPLWFEYILVLVVVGFITASLFDLIFSHHKAYIEIYILIVLILFPLGIYYGLKQKRSFYLAIIPLSLIILVSAFFIELIKSSEYFIFLFVGIFIVVTVTLLIRFLMTIQKKWHNEQESESININ